ncbi:hypothetical protein [Lysinibacillus sp. NPDC086135]|uniref:hypothetical protein n=1 Tax=Lysinibacillus sp. NPDC086135 TaxID=3364130 RepID=UPI00382E963A
MNVDHHIFLWNQASIKVLDIRYTRMKKDNSLRNYQLPASVFLFATKGSAEIQLDNIDYILKKFQVIHSGKGAHLS